jgi:hypothetical protein
MSSSIPATLDDLNHMTLEEDEKNELQKYYAEASKAIDKRFAEIEKKMDDLRDAQSGEIDQLLKYSTRSDKLFTEISKQLVDLRESIGETERKTRKTYDTSPQQTMDGSYFPGSAFPDALDGNTTFSACLLVMDENFRLPEWLAFHFHSLPLRYLVVAVDPGSKTSPTKIFDRFRKMGMTILEWTDSDFTSWRPLRVDAGETERTIRHRQRQKRFYGACLQHLYEQKRTWTTLHDADEYIVLNVTSNSTVGEHNISDYEAMKEEGWLIKHIRQNAFAVQGPCITMPRLAYGCKELSEDSIREDYPESLNIIDPFRLDTIRWRYYSKEVQLAKVLLDVSQLGKQLGNSSFPPKIADPHQPLEFCGDPWHRPNKTYPFWVHHKLGSWEAFAFREDGRNGKKRGRKVSLFPSRIWGAHCQFAWLDPTR